MGQIYLIHFDRPYHHARHYLGYTTDLKHRLDDHYRGRGARLMEVINLCNIGWRLVRVWDGTRYTERQLKRKKNIIPYCPVCSSRPRNLRYYEL